MAQKGNMSQIRRQISYRQESPFSDRLTGGQKVLL